MKLFQFCLSSLSILLPFASSAHTSTGPIADLGYVKYRGFNEASIGVNVFYGIYYAQNPTGNLRWRAPQDIEAKNNYSSSTILDATTEGPNCVQSLAPWLNPLFNVGAAPGVEDCLLLNVWTPEKPTCSKLPVMVQIHGGGYTFGNASSYPGQSLVNQSDGNVVYVSIQYRLGPLGFLSSKEVQDNGVANAGLLDQRSALKWVQRNIHAFGGDPAQVTIIGGSAGGGSVLNQMIMYGGVPDPPFRAGIAEYPALGPYHNESILEVQYQELLESAKCSDIACLRALDEVALVNASLSTYVTAYERKLYGYGDFFYGPMVDGDIIRDLPSKELRNGHFTKVPVLTDRDGYEGVIFTPLDVGGISGETADLLQLYPFATSSFFTELYDLYPSSAFNATFYQLAQIWGDATIACPSYYIASAFAAHSLPTYKLIFDAGSELHAATAPFLFAPNSNSQNATLAAVMKDWFLSFAIDLDPNSRSFSGIGKPYWNLYEGGAQANGLKVPVMDVNYTQIGVRSDSDFDATNRCEFWNRESEVVRN